MCGMLRVVGLDHVQLAMPHGREDEAREFYVGVLGLVEVAKPEPLAARGGCWFSGPGTVVHLGVENEFVPARKAHPAFLVADIDAARRTFDDVVLDDSLATVRRFYVADPFGNRIELIQDGDGFLSSG